MLSTREMGESNNSEPVFLSINWGVLSSTSKGCLADIIREAIEDTWGIVNIQ